MHVGGHYDPRYAAEPSIQPGRRGAVLTKYAITTWQQETTASDSASASYGAYMDHSGFGLAHNLFNTDSGRGEVRYTFSGGDLTASIPNVDATWKDLMVGTYRDGSKEGNILQGDATLEFEAFPASRSGYIEATFDNIRDLTSGENLPTTIRFGSDGFLRTDRDGTFSDHSFVTNNNIRGALYGPGHVEVAGVFRWEDILGAFGAKRQ